MSNKQIVIKELNKVDDYSITCKFEYPKSLNKFFTTDTFTVSYNKKINNVPKSILYIPLLSNICPIAWVNGADIKISEMDKTFLNSLNTIKQSLQEMYPNVPFTGEIIADHISDVMSNKKSGRAAVLFSGGVDSLTSYILNKDEHKDAYLVTVWGADIKLHQTDAWELVKRDNEKFGQKYNRENLFIKSNLREFLNEDHLNATFGNEIGRWWGKVQHGLALLGLCAPVSFTEGINTIYIPSSHTELFSEAWGSHPTIDNNVKWSNTIVHHHGYEFSRQQKIGIIANYIKKEDATLQIRACYTSKTGDNCSKCEKCSRTMVGLLIEGVNPNNHGFNFTSETVANIQNKFNRGTWNLAANEAFMWNDIKSNYLAKKQNVPSQYNEFFNWLINNNFETFLRKAEKNKVRKMKKLATHLPYPVYALLKKVNAALK